MLSFWASIFLQFAAELTLPNAKILDWSKLKAFAEDKMYVTEDLKIVLERVEKHCGKRRNCFSQHILKRLLSQGC